MDDALEWPRVRLCHSLVYLALTIICLAFKGISVGFWAKAEGLSSWVRMCVCWKQRARERGTWVRHRSGRSWARAIVFFYFLLIEPYLLSENKQDCLLFLFYFILNCYSVTVVPIFPSLPSSTQSTPCSHSQSPHHCLCSCVIHTCSLTSPFPFFPPLSPSPLVSVSPFHVSMPVVLFCSLVYFVH